MGLREAATDVPTGVLPAPGSEITISVLAAANTLPSGSYFCRAAYRTPWGETLPGAEVGPLVVNAGQGLQVTGTLPLGVTAVVLYVGLAAGAENFAFTSPTLPLQVLSSTLSPPQVGGYSDTPGIRNTAFMPDSDGRTISAFALYRWINDGLEDAAAQSGGGIPDMSGVASQAGVGVYTLQGNWWKLMRGWYDGYPCAVSGTDAIFRKNKVTGTYAMGLAVPHVDERNIIELWPQPSRTSGVMATTQAISAANTTGVITCAAGATSFVLPFGLAQLGPDAAGNIEIFFYSTVVGGASITLQVRGLGGTIAQAWPTNTTVTELNMFFVGLRVPPKYLIGQSAFTLNVPPGWKAALSHYLLHRFRLIERDRKEADAEYKQFVAGIKESPLNKPVGGPRQIQIGGGQRIDTVPGAGSVFGGIILP